MDVQGRDNEGGEQSIKLEMEVQEWNLTRKLPKSVLLYYDGFNRPDHWSSMCMVSKGVYLHVGY